MTSFIVEFTADMIAAAAILLLLVVIALAYWPAVLISGAAPRYTRVERQGGSALLSKDVMAMGYWAALPIARLLVRLGVSADAISWASLGLGGAAGLCLAFGHFGFAALFAILTGLLDVLDGMVARMTAKTDPAGIILDSSLDRYVDFFLLAGTALFYRFSPLLLTVTLFALLGAFMISYSTAKAEAMQIEPPRGNMKRTERVVYLIVGALLSAFSVELLEPNLPLTQPLALPLLLAIALIAVAANVSAVRRLAALSRGVSRRAASAERNAAEAPPPDQ